MENNYSVLHLLRDLTLSITLASLLLLMFYSIGHIIAPRPQFEDFSCQYKNKHCREWGKIIEENKNELKELTARADKSPQVAEKLQNQIDQLKAEMKRSPA